MNKLLGLVFCSSLLLVGCSASNPQLGVDSGKLSPCPSTPNCVNSQATEQAQFIAPIKFVGSVKSAKAKIFEIVNNYPRTEVLTEQADYLRVTFSSKIFGFVDDVEFLFLPSDDNQTTIHFRSASRLGYSDLGVNRERMQEIKLKFLPTTQD